MTFLVFSIIQKISTGSPILKFEFPLKICTKMLSWIWKIYLTSHPTKIDSKYSILTSFRVLSLLTFFSQPSSSMASWASQPASSASHWLSSSVSDFDSVYVTYYTFCYQKVNFTSSQVSWFRLYNFTKIWSNWGPQNAIFKFSEVWGKQEKSCIYHW